MELCTIDYECRAEEERQADLEKRDALAERLKEKDREKTRKIMEKSDKKVKCILCNIYISKRRTPFSMFSDLLHQVFFFFFFFCSVTVEPYIAHIPMLPECQLILTAKFFCAARIGQLGGGGGGGAGAGAGKRERE